MCMKKDIFDNNSNPFTVPDGYFDTLQERVMCRVQPQQVDSRIIPFRVLIAVAACILLIFTGAALFLTHHDKQPIAYETIIDDDFYEWFFALDEKSWLANTLDITMPENIIDNDDEDEAIIRFLERDNISVAAIVYSFDNLFH